jgi:hypothetical protein
MAMKPIPEGVGFRNSVIVCRSGRFVKSQVGFACETGDQPGSLPRTSFGLGLLDVASVNLILARA